MNRRIATYLSAGVLALSVGGAGLTHAAQQRATADPTTPSVNNVVTVGWGDKGSAANIFTPDELHLYVGDTVNFISNSALEPHTVTFGTPAAVNKFVGQGPELVTPQKNGPPIVEINPAVFYPTHGNTYDGTGVANSGFLFKGQTWHLTFSKPGTYRYFCILHYDPQHNAGMMGSIVVSARPSGHVFHVETGSYTNYSAVDAFFPRHLTIHKGDTVVWSQGFHTVTFGPDAVRIDLEKHLFQSVPQKNGPPKIVFNPKAIFPSGGSIYDGTGFLNSGIPLDPKAKLFQVTFTKPGTYEYDCLLHPGMDGTITVLADGQ